MTTYVYDRDRGAMVEKDSGMPMLNQAERARPLQKPSVFGDYPAYQSPVDGSWVDGRRARRYDMEKHNCIDANDIGAGQRGLKNERFAKKHGLEHLLK